MALRRNDARRRRLVIDPTAQPGDADVKIGDTSSAPPARRKPVQPDARTYSYGADRRNQRKTTDLIPKRVVSYLLVLLALLTCLWAINFTSVRADQWAGHIGQAGLDALAIRGRGSLAGWFSSFLLIMTGLASLQIYALRQHRCDDYRGTYRLWLWMAALMIIASINCVTNLGTVATNLVQSMTSDSVVPRQWVPLALKLMALSILMARGIYEVRESRGTLALVVFVWVAYSFAAILQLPAAQESMVGLGSDTLIGNSILFGTTALFLAHLTFARYIFLDAHGLIAQRVKTKEVAMVKELAKPNANKKRKVAAVNTKSRSRTKPSAGKTDSTAASSTVSNQPAKSRKSKSAQTPSTANPNTTKKKRAKTVDSPSDVLRELAAASRAKEQSNLQSNMAQTVQEDDQESGVQSTKAQRRKQRKLEKQRRRAA
jgi:hypothetical protein